MFLFILLALRVTSVSWFHSALSDLLLKSCFRSHSWQEVIVVFAVWCLFVTPVSVEGMLEW